MGTEGGKEKALVDHAGIPFKSVEIQGIKRSPSFSNFKAVYLAVRSPYQRETVEILEGLTSGQTCYYAYYDTLEISFTPDFRGGGFMFG